MKILMVDKYHFIKGGAERYYFELIKLLESKGHEVIPFSMQHPDNVETEYEEDFVKNIEFNGLSTLEKVAKAPEIFTRIIYSLEAKRAVSKLIDKVKPDLVHVHMIDHQLSPSILHAFAEHDLPVIQTCHQYKLVCPSYRLYVMHKNKICEKCMNGSYYHAVIEKCHKESLPASALIALESYIHRYMKIHDLIDIFHVPSKFLGDKLIEGGFPARKIWHNFYTINLEDYPYHPDSDDYCIFYGRLSKEKGVETLLKSLIERPTLKLYIVGDGPERPTLEAFAAQHELSNVKFWGNQGGTDLIKLVQNAKFVVVPSEWYDNSPLVIYESFSMGKPVIVSTLGGMPELVDHGENGLHFEAGDVETLGEQMTTLWGDEKRCKIMGKKAREKAEREFSPESHYDNIIRVYDTLLNTNHGKPVEDVSKPVVTEPISVD